MAEFVSILLWISQFTQIHPRSDKFVMGVKIEVTGESKQWQPWICWKVGRWHWFNKNPILAIMEQCGKFVKVIRRVWVRLID